MRSARRQEPDRGSPSQPRQSRQAGMGRTTSTTSYGTYDGDGDDGVTFSQDMVAMAQIMETRANADAEYFTNLTNYIRESKRKDLEAIDKMEKKAASADDSYRNRMQAPITTALELDRHNGSRQRNSSDEGTTRTEDDIKPWKAASANVIASSKKLLGDYDEISRQTKRSDMPTGRLGQSWQKDVGELKRIIDIGYKKTQREITDVMGGSRENNDGDDDREAKAHFPDRERVKSPAGLWRTLDDAERGVRKMTRNLPEAGAEFGSG